MARVLFATDQWGYGSTTCAITVATLLGGSHHTSLAGSGAGFTLAREGPFSEYVHADATAAHAADQLRQAVEASDLVVSVQNPRLAWLADGFGVPCVYLDTLTWMWPGPPRLPGGVTRYFAADFPGVQGNIGRWRHQLPPAEVVSSFVAPTPRVRGRKRKDMDLLVNFGGLSAFLVPQDALVAYARAMVVSVVEALAEWPGRITVSAGGHILNAMDPARLRLVRDDVRFESLSHPAYLARLDQCHALVSSPGVHATGEAAARGVPAVLLPPQNLSQALTLRDLPSMGPASPFDWSDLYGPVRLSVTDEARSCALIADRIMAFEGDVEARRRLANHLSAQLAPDRLDRALAAEAALFEPSRAGSGAQRVAAYVDHLLGNNLPQSPPHQGHSGEILT
jgi:hypothetical protein